jgi:hypothetical protein
VSCTQATAVLGGAPPDVLHPPQPLCAVRRRTRQRHVPLEARHAAQLRRNLPQPARLSQHCLQAEGDEQRAQRRGLDLVSCRTAAVSASGAACCGAALLLVCQQLVAQLLRLHRAV